MSFLVDTDLLSLLERRNPPQKLLAWLKQHESEVFISVVSVAELEFGVQHAPPAHQPRLKTWLAQVRKQLGSAIEPLDEPVLIRWKQLLSELKRKNRTLACEDSLIAATALHCGHTVVTRNQRHFDPAGVNLFNPL